MEEVAGDIDHTCSRNNEVELHPWPDVQTQSTGGPSFMDYIQTEAYDNWHSLSQ